MGLDMYLIKKSYVKNWGFYTPEERTNITIEKNGEKHPTIKPERISNIVEEVGSWRKFNALHNWFVHNCQNGVDDCKEYYLTIESFVKVIGVLKEVIKYKTGGAPKPDDLFPNVSGFFFGDTSYSEFYYEEVERTIEMLENLLKEDDGNGDYYYKSSW